MSTDRFFFCICQRSVDIALEAIYDTQLFAKWAAAIQLQCNDCRRSEAKLHTRFWPVADSRGDGLTSKFSGWRSDPME
jgi:hypothetical protein